MLPHAAEGISLSSSSASSTRCLLLLLFGRGSRYLEWTLFAVLARALNNVESCGRWRICNYSKWAKGLSASGDSVQKLEHYVQDEGCASVCGNNVAAFMARGTFLIFCCMPHTHTHLKTIAKCCIWTLILKHLIGFCHLRADTLPRAVFTAPTVCVR